MTVRRPASRLSPRPWRLPGGPDVLVEILAVAAGGSAPARPAFECHQSVEIR